MNNKASFVLGVSIMALSAWAVAGALHWPWKAALFPLAIGIPVFCLAAAEVVWALVTAARGTRPGDVQPAEPVVDDAGTTTRTLVAIGWMLGFFAAIALLSFPIAVPLFVFLYVKLQGREPLVWSLVFTVAVAAIFYGLFDRVLHLPFPGGWIQTWAGLN
jgi:hypothetical protein